MRLSVSFTTRAPRPGEADGTDYNFVQAQEFLARRDRGEFLEWAQVHGNFYATSRSWIEQQMTRGVDIVLEIDWQGAAQIRRAYPQAISVFIAPPSLAVLRERLTARGQDTPDVIERRLLTARSELEHANECRICYYQSRLCSGLPGTDRDRRRGSLPLCAAASPAHRPVRGVGHGCPRRTDRLIDTTSRIPHGPHHRRRLPQGNPQPVLNW